MSFSQTCEKAKRDKIALCKIYTVLDNGCQIELAKPKWMVGCEGNRLQWVDFWYGTTVASDWLKKFLAPVNKLLGTMVKQVNNVLLHKLNF